MSLEADFYKHLLDSDSMEYIVEVGLDPEVLPTPDLRPIYDYALGFYFRSKREHIINLDALATFEVSTGVTLLNILVDHDLAIIDPPDMPIADVIEKLKAMYVTREFFLWQKAEAAKINEAPTSERLNIAQEASVSLVRLVTHLASARSQVDARMALEGRLGAYAERAEGKIKGSLLGIPEVDNHFGGLQPGELGLIGGFAKSGKAQPLDEPVLTPWGWVPMGTLSAGSLVIGGDGRPTKVKAVHPQGQQECFRVEFADGGYTRVAKDHLWQVRRLGYPKGAKGWRWEIIRTEDLSRYQGSGCRKDRFGYTLGIPTLASPVAGHDHRLPIHPYLMGALLGDGGLTTLTPVLTSADDEVIDQCRAVLPKGHLLKKLEHAKYGYSLIGPSHRAFSNKVTNALRGAGLMGHRSKDKFIPQGYLGASFADRWALLQGLLDTDGYMEGHEVIITLSCPRLVRDIRELVLSMGGVATIRLKKTKRLPAEILTIFLPKALGCPFRLERKAKAWEVGRGFAQDRPPVRKITKVVPCGMEEMRCITVEHPSGLYVTRDYILTHNSLLANRLALMEHDRGQVVVLFTLENSVAMTLDRIACISATVDSALWAQGKVEPEDLDRVQKIIAMFKESDTPLHILQPDRGHRSVEAMMRNAQALNADVVLIDQLTHIRHPAPRNKPRNEVVRDIMQDLAVYAQDPSYPLPVWVFAQVGRKGHEDATKRGYYAIDDFAESSETERSADVGFTILQTGDRALLHRALFQMVFARRVPLKWWEISWWTDYARLQVLHEMRPQTQMVK